MKKILYVIIVILLSFVLVGCRGNYKGQKILSIEYQTIDYNGGYTACQKIDFIENKVYSKGFLPGITTEVEYKELYSIDGNKTEEFINELNKIGFLNLKELYKTKLHIIDGGGWNLIITYEDGSTKVSKGINERPTSKFRKADYAFYDLFGEVFFGLVDNDYMYPPTMSIGYRVIDKDTKEMLRSLSTFMNKTNYTWRNKTVNDINNIAFANEYRQIEFYDNYDYEVAIYTANTRGRFKEMVLKEYDLNGNFIKEVFKSKWFSQKEVAVNKDRVYVAETTYKEGKVDYVFSTAVERYETLPSDFSFSFRYYQDRAIKLTYESDTKILSNEFNSLVLELSEEQLFDIYKYIYQNGITDMDRTYNTTGNVSYIEVINFNCSFRHTGRSVSLLDANFSSDINKFNEGKEAANIIYTIYNKYIKEAYDSLSEEPYQLLMNQYYTNDKISVKFLDEDKCILVYNNIEYSGNYYKYTEELTIDIENTFDRINFCVGDNILIYKDYRGQILEIDDIQVGTILNPQIINN